MLNVLTFYVLPVFAILFGIRKYREKNWGRCTNRNKMTGKVVIVTGANSGIGYEVAKEMALREAEVIMACRDLEAAAEAMHAIKTELGRSSVIVPMLLDLSSIRSIKNFAEEIKSTYDEIDVIINNAGVSYPSNIQCKTNDGFEIHMGVNYLGHFLLTNLLLENLKNAESSRVVIVSSLLHEKGRLYLDDLNLKRVTQITNPYANSKLANIYFCKELAKRLHNTNVKTYAVCPGWVYTNLFRHHKRAWYQLALIFPIAFFFMRNVKQGAQTVIYCATENKLEEESGLIYRDCNIYNSRAIFDELASKKLWEISEKMIESVGKNLTEDFPQSQSAKNEPTKTISSNFRTAELEA